MCWVTRFLIPDLGFYFDKIFCILDLTPFYTHSGPDTILHAGGLTEMLEFLPGGTSIYRTKSRMRRISGLLA